MGIEDENGMNRCPIQSKKTKTIKILMIKLI